MNYIVFDLEWNQPANETVVVKEPVYLTGEIIEIGAVKLDETFKIVDELRLYVMPKYYTKMHHKIASLTHINDKCLQEKGMPFPEACQTFRQWCGEEYAYMTWSDSDLPVLIDNMLLHSLDVSEIPVCYDIQRVFAREIMRTDRQYSLDAAIEILGEQGDQAHDALHDARNTVKVCDHLDLDTYLEEYGSRVFTEQPSTRVYDSMSEILSDESLREFDCPWCGEPVRCEDFIPMPHHRLMAMGVCAQEDEFILYLECIPCAGGGFRVSRLFYEMSDDLWDRYQDALEIQTSRQEQPV